MISSIIQGLSTRYEWARKNRPRIYDLPNTETKPKISKIIGVSLWTPSSPDLNPACLRYMGCFRKQTNATSHPNIRSFKTAVEWNKMSE